MLLNREYSEVVRYWILYVCYITYIYQVVPFCSVTGLCVPICFFCASYSFVYFFEYFCQYVTLNFQKAFLRYFQIWKSSVFFIIWAFVIVEYPSSSQVTLLTLKFTLSIIYIATPVFFWLDMLCLLFPSFYFQPFWILTFYMCPS